MPLDLKAKLQLITTDPQLISYVFGTNVLPEDDYLNSRLGGNYDRYTEMLSDPQVGGKLFERVGAVLGRAVLVDSSGKRPADEEAAAIAKRIIDRGLINYEQICGDFLFSGLLCGFSVQAVVGVEQREDKGREDGEKDIKLLLPKLEFVPQRRFTFAYHNPEDKNVPTVNDEDLDLETEIVLVKGYELRLLTRRSPLVGERCPKNRFFVFTYGGIKGSPFGYGLGARIRKFFEIRNECLKAGVLTGDRLGNPPVHGTFPADLDENNPRDAQLLNVFDNLLCAISPNAHAATTEGFEINFLEASSGGHEILQWLYDTSTAEIANAIWGDRSYAEKETGSYAAANAQNDSRNENVTDSDCNSLDEQLSAQLWAWIAEQNYPKANLPHVRRETASERRALQQESEKEDLRGKRAATDIRLIVDLGLSVTPEYIKETYGEAFSLPEAPAPEPLPTDTAATDVGAPTDAQATDAVDAAAAPADAQTADAQPTDTAQLSEADFAAHVDRFINLGGLTIGIRYNPGQTRFPSFRSAKKLRSAYGFVRGYKLGGRALRCYINPAAIDGDGSHNLFLVSQLDPATGAEDEQKLMVGYDSIEAAELAYRREMPDVYFGSIRPIAISDLQGWATFAEEPALDDVSTYEQQLTEGLTQAYAEALRNIQEFVDRIAKSAATDAEKYRQFTDGIYDLFGQIDSDAIASVLGEGLAAGYFAGLYSERVDSDSFSEIAVTDLEVLGEVMGILAKEAGELDRLVGVTLDPINDRITGRAEQVFPNGMTQTYGFSMGGDRIDYHLIDAPEFSESDEDWAAIVDHAARSGKALNCRPGNIQCGGKCQPASWNCKAKASGAQAQKVSATIAKAKAKADPKPKKGKLERNPEEAVKPVAGTAQPKANAKVEQPAKAGATHQKLIGTGEAIAKPFTDEVTSILNAPKAMGDRLAVLNKELGDAKKQGKAAVQEFVSSGKADEARKLLAEHKRATEEATKQAIAKMGELRGHLMKTGGLSKEEASALAQKVEVSDAAKSRDSAAFWQVGMGAFFQMSGGKGSDRLKQLIYAEDRAFALPDGRLNVGSQDNREKRLSTLWHEMGHHVELERPDIRDALGSWVKSRATSDTQVSLRELTGNQKFKETETAYPDKFISPYVGKVYKGGDTEVLSMGLERFASPKDMLDFYRADPEHFHLVLGALRS